MVKRLILVLIVLSFLGWGAWHLIRSKKETPVSLPTLHVLSYSSFIAKWGPGPVLKEKFESFCRCRVEFVESPDAVQLVQRLKFESTLPFDVVLGFDQIEVLNVLKATSWIEPKIENVNWVPAVQGAVIENKLFVYDWGPLAFVTRVDEIAKPQSLNDLLKPEFKNKIVLLDPRTSSPGMQFLFWVVQVKGMDEGFAYLQKLSENLYSLAPSWSTAYGIFQEKIVPLVLSYGTSPVYHLIEEKSENVQALPFIEGHPIQLEYVGIPATCKECELADMFVNFIFSTEAQKILMEKNYMLPAVVGVANGTPFEKVAEMKTLPLPSLELLSKKGEMIEQWKKMRRQ
ncbi:MAG: thiamine ABC transporter substrate-binding protein [Pseudobdellovibrionaceae bacterium]